jgi:hypothetical protein
MDYRQRHSSRSRLAVSERQAVTPSDLDLAAELDDPVERDAEELRRIVRQVPQEDEKPAAPAPKSELGLAKPTHAALYALKDFMAALRRRNGTALDP